jgi:hypothetical protein
MATVSRFDGRDRGPEAALVQLRGHVLPALQLARRTASTEAFKSAEPIPLTVVLRRSDPEGFQAFLKDLYDPKSPSFRRFLSPREISDRFGPTEADYDAVRQYFVQRGFTLTEGSPNRLTLTLRGTRAQAERALSMHIGDYTLGGRAFHANDSDPLLPAQVASRVEAIAGLSDLARPVPKAPAALTVEEIEAFCNVIAWSATIALFLLHPGSILFEAILHELIKELCVLAGTGGIGRAVEPVPHFAEPYNPPTGGPQRASHRTGRDRPWAWSSSTPSRPATCRTSSP